MNFGLSCREAPYCRRVRLSQVSARTTARLAQPLRLVHPVTIAHASDTTTTSITNRQDQHGDGEDDHHDVYEDGRDASGPARQAGVQNFVFLSLVLVLAKFLLELVD